MEKRSFEAELEKFDLLAEKTQGQLTEIMSLISAKRIPSKEVINTLDEAFSALRTHYEDAVSLAKDCLHKDELPQEGSGLEEYAVAVENSSARRVRQQLEKARGILTRFTRIRSKIAVYALELKPYQDAAADLLKELSEERIEELNTATIAPKVLLDAIDEEDIHTPEGFALLDEVGKHYSQKIQWGLSAHEYYVDDSDEVSAGDEPEITVTPETVEVTNSEEAAVEHQESPEANESTDTGAFEDSPEPTSGAVESLPGPVCATADQESDNTKSGETISPVNKTKTGTPSATAFRKEIIRLGRINPLLRTLLPLLTNVGVVTKEQAFLFGVCMDCFKETDKSRNAVEISIDILARKGYLSCYQYDVEGYEREAYCLTGYCYHCLRKESIAIQMKGYWDLSFGKYKFIGDHQMQKSALIDAVKKNSVLLQYLYSMKDTLDEQEYMAVKQSIRFMDHHYYVAVMDCGEAKKCIQISDEAELRDTEEEVILLCAAKDCVPEKVSDFVKAVYLFNQGTVTGYLYAEGKLLSAQECDEDVEESETAPENTSQSKVQSESEEAGETPNDNEAKTSPEASKPEHEIDIFEDTVSVEKVNETPDEKVELSDMLKKKDTPSDEAFCCLITELLNRPASTKDQLTSVIVQAVLLANGAGLAEKRPKAGRYAEQLKLATHLLLGETPYSSEHLAAVFANPESDNKALLLSAYLLAMLNPSVSYDYSLQEQTKSFFSQYEHYFGSFGAFKPLYNKLLKVRESATNGFSPAAIALLGSDAESEAFIEKLRREAKNYLNVQSPKASMKALPPFYNNCFGERSDLHECMTIIAENKKDKDSIEFVEMILSEYCSHQKDVFTLNPDKVENQLDHEWDNVNPKNKYKLEYVAHDQAIRQFTSRLKLMLTWDEQMSNLNNRKEGISKLRVLKEEILSACTDIQKDGSWKKEKDANILSWLLLFMKDYLRGESSPLHTFSELLLTGVISVDEDGTPMIDASMATIRYYEPWRNALRHIIAEKKSVEEVKSEILGDIIDSPDEDAGLKDNLHQLKMLGRLVESCDEDYIVTDAQIKEAIESADERSVHFKEKLELAYTYNQINEIEKENLSGIMTHYKKAFYESENFASWRRFLEALECQIAEYASRREIGLRAKLDVLLKKDPDSKLLKMADELLSSVKKNLAVAEEYLNRYEAGTKDYDSSVDLILNDFNFFEDFLDHETFDKLYQECKNNDGRALKTFGWNYLEKNLPEDWTSRLRDNSKAMISTWPSGKSTTSEQIKSLFSHLELNVKSATKINGRKEETFQITVKPTPKSMADYRHPIAAFGTQLKSPINVIVLFGNYTEKQLVDTISSFDFRGVSIVLIDRPYDAARRRLIGEIFHTQTSGLNSFLLIDQVLFLYLAMHQSTERIPALLKCTLPYTTYQPFVRDGGSTSDEMFCGRTRELATLIDPNGACVVYGGRQLGKTALLQRVESRCSDPDANTFAVYSSIIRIKDEEEVVAVLTSDIEKKTSGKIKLPSCKTLKDMCDQLSSLFRSRKIVSMHLLIDEVDDFLEAIADQAYTQLQPLVDLKRETKNNFKFVIAGLHNVCRAKNATRNNGIFGQLGTPLCIRPLSPTDALKLLSRPLSYLGFQIDRYPHLETILTNTNYYPGILQFFGYMLVETLTGQYAKYYRAVNGNPPFTLQDDQLGSVMNSSDLNKSIKDKFRWSLELDPRYFMLARCITLLYHYYEEDRFSGRWLGFTVDEIIETAKDYEIRCLKNETQEDYKNLLDEMEEMGILSRPEPNRYRLRRNSYVDIIGDNIDILEKAINDNNQAEVEK